MKMVFLFREKSERSNKTKQEKEESKGEREGSN